MEVKTNGLKMPNGDIHVFIPPSPTETERGGIKAKDRTTESLEVKYDKKTGKLFSPTSPTDDTLTQPNVAADAKKTGDELYKVNNSIFDLDNTKANAIIESATGEVIKTEISSDSKLVNLKVFGKSEQVVSKGYQLFDASKLPTKSQGGATVTNNGDGSFTISGSGNLSSNFFNGYDYSKELVTPILKALKAGNIYMKQEMDVRPFPFFVFRKKNGEKIELNKNQTNYMLTEEIIKEIDNVSISFYDSSGNAIVPGTIKPMIYQDGDGTWEPFTNGKPTPAPDNESPIVNAGDKGNIEVGITGRNLIDEKEIHKASKNWFISNSTYGGKGIYLRGGVTYTFSCDGFTDGLYVQKYGAINENLYKVYGKQSLTFTPPKDIKVQLMIYKESGISENLKIQLEIGAVATAYEPYKEPQSLTISTPNGLPGIKVESNGNYTDENGQQWICDEINSTERIQRIGKIESYNNEPIDTEYMSSTGELSVGAEVIYVLKEPIITPLDEEEKLSIKNLHSNYQTTIISNDENAGMEVSYVADTKNYFLNREKAIQTQITNIQNAMISQKISGGGIIRAEDSAKLPIKNLRLFGRSEQVQTTGANLFDEQKTVIGFIMYDGRLAKGDQEIKKERTSEYILLPESETSITATALGQPLVAPDGNCLWVALSFYDEGKNFILRTDNRSAVGEKKYTLTGTIPQEAKYVRLSYRKYNDVVVMLNAGSVAIPYEPYTGGNPSPSPEYPQPIIAPKGIIAVDFTDGTNHQKVDLNCPREFTKWDKLEKVDGVWNWVYYSRWIESYAEESITGEYISTTGGLDIGATIYYKSSPEYIPLPQAEQDKLNALTMYAPNTEVTNTGGCNMELTYTVDTKSYVDTKIAEVSTAIVQKGIE